MIVTFIRSSSAGSYKLCQTQFFIEYNLGIKGPSGKKATLGNVVHKALECLSWKSKYLADGLTEYEDETFGLLQLKDVTPEWCVEASYYYYKKLEPHIPFKDHLDLRDCQAWMVKTLELSGGYFNPANLNVIQAEKRFDITIHEPWGSYEYEVNGEIIKGQLGLKGTVDLVVQDKHDPDVIEIIDWKTGARKDWGTGKEKTFEMLGQDGQLLLYYYALSKEYPTKQLILTIVYINDGGPFRLTFGPSDLAAAENMIKKTFNDIRNNQRPSRLGTWFCEKVCHFGRSASEEDPSKTICQHVTDTISEIGVMGTLEKLGVPGAFGKYHDGGGRRNVD